MNRKIRMLLLAGVTAALPLSNVFAQSSQEQIQQIVDSAAEPKTLPPTLDDKGNIKAVKFVGIGVLHKSLPKAIRLKKAASEAQTSARRAASQFFNTRVKWQKTEDGEIICKTTGTSEGESEGNSTEESSATELTKGQSHECSEAALSGLIQVGQGPNKNDMYVVVLAWNPKTSAFASAAAKIMGKTARETITEAKAAEGASLQDPNEAYRKASAKDEAEERASGAGVHGGSGRASSTRNSAPEIKTTMTPGAEEFF